MTLESTTIEHCAPTLAGLKPASLYRYCPEEPEVFAQQFRAQREALRRRGLELLILKGCRRSGGYLLYLYRPDALECLLAGDALREFLRGEGYDAAGSVRALLRQLARRLCLQQEFPHEIGVFLGYPLEDVTGFIRNRGQGYTFCGEWKSYGDPDQARQYFAACRDCTAAYKRQYAEGTPLSALIVAA